MKREASVCGLVFIEFCVLNDKVDICWIIRERIPRPAGNGEGCSLKLPADRACRWGHRPDETWPEAAAGETQAGSDLLLTVLPASADERGARTQEVAGGRRLVGSPGAPSTVAGVLADEWSEEDDRLLHQIQADRKGSAMAGVARVNGFTVLFCCGNLAPHEMYGLCAATQRR